MKITIVTGFFLPVPPVRGGATEKIWHRLAQDFAARGHEVTFVSRAWPEFPHREIRSGVTHIRIRGADHTRSLPVNLWRDFRWGRRVTRVLPPADVTICNTVALPIWLKRFRPDAGRVVSVIARMPKGQVRFYGGVDLFLALSGAVRTALVRSHPSIAARVVPFPFPIDWEVLATAGHARQPPGPAPIIIGYVGRIHPEKGIRLLLEAAARLAVRTDLPPWRLQLVGPTAVAAGGGGVEYWQRLFDEFSGRLGGRLAHEGAEYDPARLASRYAGIDIFCYPSIAESGETFGVAVAEAMASRAAPVVSRLECFHELVTPDETGLVFDHRAADAAARLALQLERLLRNPNERVTIAARAQEHVRQFDYAVVAASVLRYLQPFVPGVAVGSAGSTSLRD